VLPLTPLLFWSWHSAFTEPPDPDCAVVEEPDDADEPGVVPPPAAAHPEHSAAIRTPPAANWNARRDRREAMGMWVSFARDAVKL
jgi:hypothetical protein